MSKDPAFLFYYQDFLVGTGDMTNEEVGAYIRCLCFQAAKGSISEKHMKNICNSYEVQKTIISKFKNDQQTGNLINERLQFEVEKRKKYTESRADNRKKKEIDDKDMKNISKTYVQHMENENENENENINVKRNVFQKPSILEIQKHITEKGYNIDADNFYNFYESKGWMIGKNKMKSWQAALVTWSKNGKTNGKTYSGLDRSAKERAIIESFSGEVTAENYSAQ